MTGGGPCLDCPDRHLHCHEVCEAYQEFARNHRQNAGEQERIRTRDMYSYKYERAVKARIRAQKK